MGHSWFFMIYRLLSTFYLFVWWCLVNPRKLVCNPTPRHTWECVLTRLGGIRGHGQIHHAWFFPMHLSQTTYSSLGTRLLNLRNFSLPAMSASYIAGLSHTSHETHFASPIPSHGLYIVLIIAQPQIHASSLLVTVSSLSNTMTAISQSFLNIYS